MFKKTKIAAATVALLSAAAVQNVSAVALDDSGYKSQVLIVPYYNTNNGFQTSVNLRNTTNQVKAVKVRIRESKVSNDVLDFNVYMSAFDHFSFTINASNDKAQISTSDTTCTYPHIALNTPVVLKAGAEAYTATSYDDAREGYIEIIEMGEVTDTDVITGVTHATSTSTGTPKTTKGVPVDCNVLDTAWAGNQANATGGFRQGGAHNNLAYYSDGTGTIPTPEVVGAYNALGTNHGADADPTLLALPGLRAPRGGLQAYSILIDTVNGAAFVGDAVGIRNYSTTAQHYLSDSSDFYLLPSLASGSDKIASVVNAAGTGITTTTFVNAQSDYGQTDLNVAPNSAIASGWNPFPIAQVLSTTTAANDYFINPNFEASTDWVVTFPLRKHGIHPIGQRNQNIKYDLTVYDREEQKPSQAVGFSPVLNGTKALEREANVLTFASVGGATKPVLGSKNAVTVSLQSGYVEGWGSLAFDTPDAANIPTGPVIVGSGTAAAPQFAAWSSSEYAKLTKDATAAIGFAAIRANLGQTGSRQLGETVPHAFKR